MNHICPNIFGVKLQTIYNITLGPFCFIIWISSKPSTLSESSFFSEASIDITYILQRKTFIISMLSKMLQPKIVLYIYICVCVCFTYIFPKPATKFLHLLLLNNIISHMKREINLDLRYVYTVQTNMLVLSQNIVLECCEMIHKDISVTREIG